MPSRVRMIGSHPQYGVYIGGNLAYTIGASWNKKFPIKSVQPIRPVGFKDWPHWKRTVWFAKSEGNWKMRVFRDVRKSDIRKSLYGRSFYEFGLPIKPLKNKMVIKLNKGNKVAWAPPIDPIFNWPDPGQAIPVQPPAPNQLQQVQPLYMEVNAKPYMWRR